MTKFTWDDLLSLHVIRNAENVDELTRPTLQSKLIETIVRLADDETIAITIGLSPYSGAKFRQQCKQWGAMPYGTRLRVLRYPDPEMEGKAHKVAPAGIQFKDESATVSGGAHVLDDVAGLVSAIVSVTNVVDDVNDIIAPGAFQETLSKRLPKGVDAHQWEAPIARTLAVEELMPGDPRLPENLQLLGAGGLLVLAEFNLETQRGRDAYADVKFFGDSAEWSIGYAVPPGGSKTDPKTGIRTITKLDLLEYSPVLFGANAYTGTLALASAWSPAVGTKVFEMSLAESMRGWVRSCGIPNTKANRRKVDALIAKASHVPPESLADSMMAFALSANAAKSPVGRLKARALVAKALGENDASGDAANPGLTVAPHPFSPPSLSSPITEKTPCIVCGLGPLDQAHTNAASLAEGLRVGGGSIAQPRRYLS